MTLTPGLNYGYYTRSGRQYLDPADLKEVEIDKGPGAGGLAGRIRLRSKDPEDYLRENARTGGEIRGGNDGENDDISTGASIAARLDDRNSASLSYNRHWFGERKNRSGADIDGPNRHYNNPLDGRSNSLNGKWQYRPNDAHRLKLTLQHYDVDNDSRQRQRIGTASRGAGNILDSRNDRRNVRNAAHAHLTAWQQRGLLTRENDGTIRLNTSGRYWASAIGRELIQSLAPPPLPSPQPTGKHHENPLSPAQHTALRVDLARQPGQILENLAAGYGVSLEAVLTCLPDDMHSKTDGGRILDILAAVATWEHPVTFIVHTADLIAETSGRLPPGRVARGYYS